MKKQDRDLALFAIGLILAYLATQEQQPEGIPAEVIALDENPIIDLAATGAGLTL